MAVQRELLSAEPALRYRGDSFLVVEKPAGMLVHPVRAGEPGTLTDWIREHCELEPHLVGRLDRDTSGLVLVATSGASHRSLARQVAAGRVRRRYRALVDGRPERDSGVIDAPIGRSADDPPLRAVTPDGAPARTRYRVVEFLPDASLVELELETGRTHQIRVHMAHLGNAVLGDRWYGRRGLAVIARQALHACTLVLPGGPGEDTLQVEAPLPADMVAALDVLRGQA